MYSLTPLNILLHGFQDMHSLLDRASAMTPEQLNFRPGDGAVTPFFSLWHYVRTEDNIVNFVTQKQTTVWLDGGFDEKLGLPKVSQGTGMTAAEASAVQVHEVAVWHDYQRRTWQATMKFLHSLADADLQDRTVFMKPQGERRLWDPLYVTCLAHGYRHVGEIEYARGVIGLGNATGV